MTPSGTPSVQTPSPMGSWPESPSLPLSSLCGPEGYLVYAHRLYSHSDFDNCMAGVYEVLGTVLLGLQ